MIVSSTNVYTYILKVQFSNKSFYFKIPVALITRWGFGFARCVYICIVIALLNKSSYGDCKYVPESKLLIFKTITFIWIE